MIFFGSRSKHLKTERVSGLTCQHCQNQGSTNISIFAKYAHIYWLPFFPMGKTGVSECNHCKITLAPKDMNQRLKDSYYKVKSDTKTPIFHYFGLGLIGAFIILMIYAVSAHKNDVKTYIENPRVGDVYDYKPNDYYSTLKVTEVTQDSIILTPNGYEIEKKSKLYKIDKSENYTGKPYAIGKNELKRMYDNKTILDIDRD
ncbi:hypothetical protein UMM65_11420 [Aureibaculum sp. 2210JD6-5]|uniref:hypothetical protein n=1 Tax=Aureibaculum sp. 2210JD6-5 TaxID=3103957 RepID=UPI002AAE7B7A|nr:hypothetical protein [Aureibaculum sp. 2210JD6-5]MDY7395856.1 hypothetical protein [Aureibaculum sp. 2210JD6-5]